MPGIRHKYHRPRQKKTLDGYDDFNTYVVVGSLTATNNFGRLDVQRYAITLEARRVVIRLFHNNNNTTVLSTLFIPYLCESYEKIIVTNQITKVSQNWIVCAPNKQNQTCLVSPKEGYYHVSTARRCGIFPKIRLANL